MDYLPSDYLSNDNEFYNVGTNSQKLAFIDRDDEIESFKSFLKQQREVPKTETTSQTINLWLFMDALEVENLDL